MSNQDDRIVVDGLEPIGARTWFRFFVPLGFEYLHHVDPKVKNIRFGDVECSFAGYRPDEPSRLSFLNDARIPSRHQQTERESETIVAELKECDIVLGADAVSARLLETVKSHAQDTELFMLGQLCTPLVTGIDLEWLTNELAEASNRPVISYHHNRTRKPETMLEDILRAVQQSPGTYDGEPTPGLINLFCYDETWRDTEMIPLLREIGLEINTVALPDIRLGALRRIGKAEINAVCLPSAHGKRLLESLQDDRATWITTPAPHGVRNTHACLKTIAEAAGLQDAFEEAFARRFSSMREDWDERCAEARQRRLGIVVDGRTLIWLGRPNYLGMSILEVLGEMGFNIDLLFYQHTAEAQVPRQVLATWQQQCNLRVLPFTTQQELDRLLAAPDLNAVYSDFFFDERIMCAGKTQFSAPLFEMGLSGALQTIEELLGRCRVPFFTRYREHLGGRDV